MLCVILPNHAATGGVGGVLSGDDLSSDGSDDTDTPPPVYTTPVTHVIVLLYLVYSVVVNMIMVMRVEANGDPTALPVVLKPGRLG